MLKLTSQTMISCFCRLLWGIFSVALITTGIDHGAWAALSTCHGEENSTDGYECSCPEGYTVSDDKMYCKDSRWIGCHLFNREDWRVNDEPLVRSVAICTDKCKRQNETYAGLMRGEFCLCSSTFRPSGPVSSAHCNYTCPGNTNETCGGDGRIEVFRVCQIGFYRGPSGDPCGNECHCGGGSICDYVTGLCLLYPCQAGWTGSACNTRDCSINNGGCEQICVSEGFRDGCHCVDGYTKDTSNTSACEEKAHCDSCTITKDPDTSECHHGYTWQSSSGCTDIDECADESLLDPACVNCRNTLGSYECSCLEGFSLNDDMQTCNGTDCWKGFEKHVFDTAAVDTYCSVVQIDWFTTNEACFRRACELVKAAVTISSVSCIIYDCSDITSMAGRGMTTGGVDIFLHRGKANASSESEEGKQGTVSALTTVLISTTGPVLATACLAAVVIRIYKSFCTHKQANTSPDAIQFFMRSPVYNMTLDSCDHDYDLIDESKMIGVLDDVTSTRKQSTDQQEAFCFDTRDALEANVYLQPVNDTPMRSEVDPVDDSQSHIYTEPDDVPEQTLSDPVDVPTRNSYLAIIDHNETNQL